MVLTTAVVLGLGYGLNRSPVEWAALFHLALPAAVVAMALLTARTPTLVGASLAIIALLPNSVLAWRAGAIPLFLSGLLAAMLCAVTGLLLTITVDLHRVRARVQQRMAATNHGADPADVLLDEALAIAGAEMGEILLCRNGSERLEQIAARCADGRALSATSATFDEGHTVAEWVLRKGRPCIYHLTLENASAPQTVAVLPLRGTEGVAGVLCVYSAAGRRFARQELSRLQVVVEAGTTALLQRAPIVTEPTAPTRPAHELSALEEIARTINASLDLGATLKAILTSTRRLIDFDVGEVTLWDPAQHCLVSRAVLDADAYQVEAGDSCRLDEGYAGWLARQRKPLLISDTSKRQDVRPKPDWPHYRFRSYLGIPLGSRGEFVGTLELTSYRPHAFTANDLDLLQIIGHHAATAVDHARLYEEARHRALELTSLTRVLAAMSSTLDPERVLQTIAASVLEVIGCHQSAIFVRHEGERQLRLAATYGLRGSSSTADQALPLEAGGPAHAAATGQPLIVEEVGLDPALQRLIPLAAAEQVAAFAAIPLRAGEQVIGLLAVLFTCPHRFTAVERELLTSFADQAAMAMENARLYSRVDQELQSRADALAGLQRIAREMSATLDQNRVLQLVLEETLRLSQATRCAIFVRPTGSEHWELGVCAGCAEKELDVLRQQLGRHDRTYDAAGWQTVIWSDAHSTLLVPMWYGDRLVGLIALGGDHTDVCDAKVQQVVETLAAQAAVAIENVRLLADLKRQVETLSLLNELSRSMAVKLDLDEVLRIVVDATTRLIHCRGSVVFLQDPDTGRYVAQAVHGHDAVAVIGRSFAPNEGLVGRVAASRRPLSVPDAQAGDYLEQGAVTLVPLCVGDQVVGILTADRPYQQAFTATGVSTLTALADQVAVAVQNARLFDEAVRRTEELSTLLEASNTLSSTLDLNWVLQALGSRLLSMTAAERCLISEWDQEEGRVGVVWEAGELSMRSMAHFSYPGFEQSPAQEALLTHEPMLLWADDPQASQEAQAYLTQRQAHAALLLPMVSRGQAVGLVELQRQHERRAFTPGEIRLAQALANQAAAAMQNARLYEEIRRFSEELEQRVEERTRELARALHDLTAERDRIEVLYRITAEVSTGLDLDRALNRALELVVSATDADQGFVLLEDPMTNELTCRAAVGVPMRIPPGGQRTAMRRGEGLAGWVIEHGEGAFIPDLQNDPRWDPGEQFDPTLKACLAVPLDAAGETLGVLLLFANMPEAFADTHLRVAEAAAAQLANAVGNAALYNLLREQAERLGAMLKQQQVEAAKSQAILEGVADGVIVADAQGQVMLFNAAAERVLEIPRAEALGRSLREMLGLYGVEGRAWLTAMEGWVANPAEHAPEDFAAERLELGSRVLSAHVSPVVMGSEYLGTVSVFRDITAEVEADRAKSDFVSTVSHELRTPMTSIKGYVDLLLMGSVGALSEQQQHFLSIIRSNADRLTVLVNDLLDISRIETGRLEPDLRPVHLHGVVNQVVNTLLGRATSREVSLQTEAIESLPPVLADSAWLTQILTNLVGNAIQYTPSGGTVTISACCTPAGLEVSVTDTGIGISAENQAKIFDRFFRADDPLVQETGGTGLGLPITRSLVQMLGGEIWVESEVGVGSTFTFSLPLALTEPAPLPPSPTSVQVLVVEDDPDVANLIRIHLEAEGYEVVTVARGDEALQIARQTHPALITLDIRLPDTDGFVVLERLKENPQTADIPVVIVSVIPDTKQVLRLGALDYVGKPIDEKALLEAVRKVLRQRGLILVVDDDRDNLALMREVLRRYGFRVRTTGLGRQALRVAREARPALILLDLVLRDISGDEVLQKLKSHPNTCDIPVVVMTGSFTHEELKQQRVLALGAARFLTKPFAIEDLIEEITTLLQRAGHAQVGRTPT